MELLVQMELPGLACHLGAVFQRCVKCWQRAVPLVQTKNWFSWGIDLVSKFIIFCLKFSIHFATVKQTNNSRSFSSQKEIISLLNFIWVFWDKMLRNNKNLEFLSCNSRAWFYSSLVYKLTWIMSLYGI